MLFHGIPPAFYGGVHLFIPPTAIGSVPSLSGHAKAYRWRSLSRTRRHTASSPQGNSSYGYCLFRYHHGAINVHLSYPTPTILLLVCNWTCVIQKGSETVSHIGSPARKEHCHHSQSRPGFSMLTAITNIANTKYLASSFQSSADCC